MLRVVLRLLAIGRIAGAIEVAKAEFKARARDAAKTAAVCGIAGVLVLVGGVFVCVAAMLALATVWPMHWAALTVGGILIAIAGLALLSIRPPQNQLPSQPQRQKPAVPPPEGAEQPADLSDLLRPAEAWIRQNPGKATFGAVAAGLVLGLMSNGKDHPND